MVVHYFLSSDYKIFAVKKKSSNYKQTLGLTSSGLSLSRKKESLS